ncbi:MAG: hypothetical protein Ct9H300mP12_10960 [Acidimicrobiales bacterium]|nr:MAG: hypothetical protein Ct9H300mP12_10960 [Acidimicrobiales bacterium]
MGSTQGDPALYGQGFVGPVNVHQHTVGYPPGAAAILVDTAPDINSLGTASTTDPSEVRRTTTVLPPSSGRDSAHQMSCHRLLPHRDPRAPATKERAVMGDGHEPCGRTAMIYRSWPQPASRSAIRVRPSLRSSSPRANESRA